MKRIAMVLALSAMAFTWANAQELLPYQDRSLTPEQRADDLISRLTIEEKTSLLMNSSQPVPRLGIKGYNWWNEALHGVARNGSATTFPQPIGMAASFDYDLLYEVFTAVSDEGRVKNRQAVANGDPHIYQGLTYWTPNINIFRDPRWGRGMETYGEDPYLTGRLGIAVVKGLQGPDSLGIRKAHACAKHYAVHSGPESERHSFDAQVSERDLRETYLPAFRDLVVKAGVEEVMTAYNRFRGEPCGASPYLIDTLLRGEWGYKGIITSDCGAIDDFWVPGRHEWVPDRATAAAFAVRSGVDTECGGTYRSIPEAVSRGLLDEKFVDRNLRRLLIDRYRLGEMDGISLWDDLSDDIVEGPDHKALALKMAYETMVLLQNRGGILPLKAGDNIALIGPNADDEEMMWGNYNPIPKEIITLKEALEERVPSLLYLHGCGRVGTSDTLDVPSGLKSLEGKDIVIFAGGLSGALEGEELRLSIPGFSGGDRTSLELPEIQRTLLNALKEAGKKIILVNFSGSAVGLVPETSSCEAILQAWYPGQMGGKAIADVLYGEVSPSGKLPVTFYKNVDQLPDFRDYSMKDRTYRYFTGEPLYPFGYGLSYTSFKTGRPKIRGGKVIVKVRNTGKMDADEVIQLYIRRPSDAEGPLKTLRGFARVTVPAGKSVKVSIPIDEETFTWWDPSIEKMVPLKGRFEVLVGTSSARKDLRGRKYNFKG